MYIAQIKQFSPRGIFRRRMRSGTRLASHPITLWDGSVFFALGTILSWLLSTFFCSLSPPHVSVVPFSSVISATSLSPPSFHISDRIASRKNYNCIKDVSRLAHCSTIPRGVVPRRGISIDLAIDSLMESVQLRRYSKIYSSQ